MPVPTVGAARFVAAFLTIGVVAVATQTPPGLHALTVPDEALPNNCALKKQQEVAQAPRPGEGETTIRSAWPRFPTNPWSGTDPTLVAEVRKAVDGTPRLPDGPPLDRRDTAAFLLKLADNVVEAYRAAYVAADGSAVDVWAITFNDTALASAERLPGATKPPPGFRNRTVRGATVVVVAAPSSSKCVQAVDDYIQALEVTPPLASASSVGR